MIEYLKNHGVLYKNLCPKFQRILASRACRSAVMIGSPLTSLQLQKVFSVFIFQLYFIKYFSFYTSFPKLIIHGYFK